jgi:hypothetical protein
MVGIAVLAAVALFLRAGWLIIEASVEERK